MAREINAIWDRHGTVYGTTSTVVFVCRGTSVETRLSVPDFVSQQFGDKIRNGTVLSHASLVPRL